MADTTDRSASGTPPPDDSGGDAAGTPRPDDTRGSDHVVPEAIALAAGGAAVGAGVGGPFGAVAGAIVAAGGRLLAGRAGRTRARPPDDTPRDAARGSRGEDA